MTNEQRVKELFPLAMADTYKVSQFYTVQKGKHKATITCFEVIPSSGKVLLAIGRSILKGFGIR